MVDTARHRSKTAGEVAAVLRSPGLNATKYSSNQQTLWERLAIQCRVQWTEWREEALAE